ncbi:MAG: DUF3105 domain-containing protein [Deltaproteobacteria bacterium]|nr:DUF3105 domain-containing protein [Deltaproteobacteria bacterium]
MQRHLHLSALVVAVLVPGCGGRSTFDFVFDEPPPLPEPGVCSLPEGSCSTLRCDLPLEEGMHVSLCEPLAFTTNPPTSGPHYPVWGLFKTYDEPLARGFYLHDAEHSGIVLLYNCERLAPGGDCSGLVAALTDYVAEAPQDPKCVEPTRHRLIVTPDPLLDVPFAAVAWGHSLKAECFDRAAVDAFVGDYYGKNYEDFCSGGIDPTDPESGITPGCGL